MFLSSCVLLKKDNNQTLIQREFLNPPVTGLNMTSLSTVDSCEITIQTTTSLVHVSIKNYNEYFDIFQRARPR